RGMERLRFAPWGVAGGRAGATGRAVLNPGAPGERAVSKIDLLALAPGDVLSVRTPGGGGHGNPFERPPSQVRAGVESGRLTPARARDAYGVVVTDGGVDEAATAALRAGRAASDAPGAAAFDFGAARDAHERRWPPALQDAFVALLMALPLPYRAFARRALYPRVTALAERRALTPSDLTPPWPEPPPAARPSAPVLTTPS